MKYKFHRLSSDQAQVISRRAFLQKAAGATVGLALVPLVGCETNLVEPRNAGFNIPFLTPADEFFEQFGAAAYIFDWEMPNLQADQWRLTIDGLVNNPLTLTLDDILAEQQISVLKTIRCVIDTNAIPGLIGNAIWTGTPLRTFLDRAGIDRDRTRRLRFYATDGFLNNLKIEQVYGDRPANTFEPLLVTQLNGIPLTPAHGFPARLLVFDRYGFKNVKWIERIEATDSDEVFGTYQQDGGFADDGTIQVISKMSQPVNNLEIEAGTFLIVGFALSGFAPIDRVELSFNNGDFEEARIIPLSELQAQDPMLAQAQQVIEGADAFPYQGVWVKFEFRWQAEAGEHLIQVRATDKAGNAQPLSDNTFEDGINAIAAIRVTVGSSV